MARIKCKNCGKAYRYETEGCCPECGAYNRPPRHEKVNADGTIYHMKDADYLEKRRAKPHGSKVCFEEKECYEEKACYEEQGYYEKEYIKKGLHSVEILNVAHFLLFSYYILWFCVVF